MKVSIKALVVTSILIGLFVYWWVSFKERVDAPLARHELIDQLETVGVPSFNTATIEGNSVVLKELSGKLIILNFWASWCAPCIEEIPSLIKLVKEFKGEVKLVAVSGDSNLEDINVFLKSFPELKAENIYIVWDKDQVIAQQYGIDKLPESFVIGKDFKLVKKIIGTINWYTPDSIEYLKFLINKK
jgi:cytochrome c biogenesis protein CcmG, thiol:disulfide interchange protein DsbE